MSIASIVAWLWLVAQQGPLPNLAGWNIIGDCQADETTRIIDCRQKTPVCTFDHIADNADYIKPAEHVIEIRTKRHFDQACWDRTMEKYGECCEPPSGNRVPYKQAMKDLKEKHIAVSCGVMGMEVEFNKCKRVTREIWIDGTRYGVLKEADAK